MALIKLDDTNTTNNSTDNIHLVKRGSSGISPTARRPKKEGAFSQGAKSRLDQSAEQRLTHAVSVSEIILLVKIKREVGSNLWCHQMVTL